MRHLKIIPMIAAMALSPIVVKAETVVFSGAGAGPGGIEVFETAETAAEFYGARNSAPFPVNADGLNLFFHRDTNTNIFSLGLVVDDRNDGTNGRLTGTITGLDTGASVVVADDNATEFRISTPGTAVFNFRFFGCCTDGGVISGLDSENLNLSINITRSEGLTGTFGAGPTGLTSLGGAPGVGDLFAITTAPEPRSWALFFAGFGGLAFAMKQRRRGEFAYAAPVKD